MRYLLCTTQKPDGPADGAAMQSAYKVDDVAMLACPKVIPLVALCVHLERRGVLSLRSGEQYQ